MLDIKFIRENSEKKVARINSYIILLHFSSLLIVALYSTVNNFSLIMISVMFIFLFLSIVILFYSKIELNNNFLIIKSPFIVSFWMFPQTFLRDLHVIIDINNIQEMKFASMTYLCIKEDIIIIYYLLPNGTKSKVAISQLIFPDFKNILNEILKSKPDLKITYKKK